MNRRVLLAGLFGVAALVYSVRLRAPFEHYHENVTACYASWGRNALRFGSGVSGFAPIRGVGILPGPGVPSPRQLYSHRPPTVTFLVALSCRLFGPGEGALRAVGIVATLAALAVFWAVARRLLGAEVGFAAAALFAFLPGVAFYGVVIAHQTFGILGALLILLAYLRWQERPEAGRLAQLGAAVLTGCWLDWPAYYAAGVVGLVQVLKARERRWVGVAVPGVAVLSLGLFVAYVYALDPQGRVPLKDLFSTGAAHSGGVPLALYAAKHLREAVVWFTAPLLALAAIGVARLRPRANGNDALVLSTLLLGADAVLFRSLSYGHPFMIVPWAPFLALAGARGLQTLVAVRWGRIAASMAVLGIVLQSGAVLVRAHRGGTYPYPTEAGRALGEAIRATVAPGERVLVRLSADKHVLGYYADRPIALFSPTARVVERLDDISVEEGIGETELLRRLQAPGHGYDWFVTATFSSAAEHLSSVRGLRSLVADPHAFARDHYGFEGERQASVLVAGLRETAPELPRGGFQFYDLRARR